MSRLTRFWNERQAKRGLRWPSDSETCGYSELSTVPSSFASLMFAFKGSDATICSAVAEEVGSEMRTAGDRTRRRRLNKLSCAGWLPHDRGFVSGLPRSKDERRSGDRLITGQEGSHRGPVTGSAHQRCVFGCRPPALR